jgi:L-threonylcarbamoyladenylate synthase
MNVMTAQRLDPDTAGIATAAGILNAGGLVAFPTETVYGLGADARDGRAVARVYEAKGRPAFNPLIVHVPDLQTAQRYGTFDAQMEQLAQAFWPGPLTLVVPLVADHGLSALVTAGLDTVALRVPANPLAQKLLKAFGGPVAAPSANPSGRISTTTADHVLAGLSVQIDAVLDGGACSVGLESTIIGGAPLALLRPGGLSSEAIEKQVGTLGKPGAKVTAPGQLASHYAPRAATLVLGGQSTTGSGAPLHRARSLAETCYARPADADRLSGSIPNVAKAAAHLPVSSVANTSSGLASTVSQPFCAISPSNWPLPHPA